MDETDILVVDDERQVREFVARALSQRGLTCRTAVDGREAVAQVLRRTPSLVITDLGMPGRDGRWLLGELKRRWPELPIIMLTGDGDAQTAVQCLKDGADDYLVKPVDLEELWISAKRAVEKVRLVKEFREQRAQLGLVQAQTDRLREAFGIIETTYRDALGALLHVESLEKSGAPKLARNASPGAKESTSAEAYEPRSTENMEAGNAIELSGLRVAGRLIGDGAPFVDVGTAIANELVERNGLTCVRIWIPSEDEEVLVPRVDVGYRSVPGRDQAAQTISSAKIERIESNGITSLCCPILVNGSPRAVVQLVAPTHKSAKVARSAERLSLILAASLAREQDARERRQTMEELDLLYELASASRYSLDLEPVAEFLLESLDKVVDYDVAGLLLIDDDPTLNIQTRFVADDEFIRRVRKHVLTNLKLTCGIEPPKNLTLRVRNDDSARSRSMPAKLRSFVNVPFTVSGSVAGLVYLGSGRDRAFDTGEIQFIHRAANFLATSVQGVRDLVAAVKSRIEQMVDHMTDGVLMLDRRGNVVAMNGAVREALNCRNTAEQPMNSSSLAKILEFDPLDLLKTERRSLRKLVCVHDVPYQAQMSPVLSDGGDLVGAVLAFRNFQQEQRLDEMKTELINVVSHELRTPLTAIKIALSLLSGTRLGELEDKQRHFVELAQRNVEHLVRMVNDLLDLSKLEAGKMHVDLEPLSLVAPIQAASSALEAQAEAKGVSLEISVTDDLPRVYGDASSIERVLINLIGNAIKFTERGGRIGVEAVGAASDFGNASGTAVKVVVTDSGIGIPKDQLEHIFDKFHQVARSKPYTATGTGLGLPICRELVKAHYGRIWAESEEGSGSRFCFALPLFEEHELLLRCLDSDIVRAREHGMSIGVALLVCEPEGSRTELPASVEARMPEELTELARRLARGSAGRVCLIEKKAQVAVILPRNAGEVVSVFGERVAKEVQRLGIARGGFPVRVGYSAFPDDSDSAESLYSKAEARLGESVLV